MEEMTPEVKKLRRDAENILTWETPKDGDPLMFGHLRRFAKEILRLTEPRIEGQAEYCVIPADNQLYYVYRREGTTNECVAYDITTLQGAEDTAKQFARITAPPPCERADRVPLCVAPETRQRLVALLYTQQFQGVGYTAFLERAMKQLAPEWYEQSLAHVALPQASGLP